MRSSKKDKPVIVLLHGYRGTPLGLEALAKALGRGREVRVPALPPFGGAGEMIKYNSRSYADFVAGWIQQSGLEKPVLVGHSMGSIVAAAVAERHPDLINEKVVFLAPIAKRAPRLIGNLAPLATILSNDLASWITTRYLYVAKDPEGYRKTLEVARSCGADCASRKGARGAASFSASAAIADFEIRGKKLLFLTGTGDKMNSRKQIEEVAKKLGGKTCYIEGAGHLLNSERPKETAREILKFLR